MVKTLIEAFPKEKKPFPKGEAYLNVSEMFQDTIQGEGINIGKPATFLRVQRCTLNCVWCDTSEVWRKGNPYTINEILDIWEKNKTVEQFRNGQSLVLTGGSPVLQQKNLVKLLSEFEIRYNFKPYIEIENECTLMPNEISKYVDCWNNSPKLANSEMAKERRYKPEIIKYLSKQDNSWFKFVVTNESDWDEIKKDYLDTNLIRKEQIMIMPEGVTRKELQQNYQFAMDICIRENLRLTDRLHVTIFNKKTGV